MTRELENSSENACWYHGGSKRIAEMGFVEPAIAIEGRSGTNIAITEGRYLGHGLYDKGRVYITRDFQHAVRFALRVPGGAGAVFEVKPIGEINPDLDAPLLGNCGELYYKDYTCDRAEVIRRIDITKRDIVRNRRSMLELHKAIRQAGIKNIDSDGLKKKKMDSAIYQLANKKITKAKKRAALKKAQRRARRINRQPKTARKVG